MHYMHWIIAGAGALSLSAAFFTEPFEQGKTMALIGAGIGAILLARIVQCQKK
jgi:hypothetical protein